MNTKVIRSICVFTNLPSIETITKVNELADKLKDRNFIIQTKRICSANKDKIKELDEQFGEEYTFSIGSIPKIK